MKCVILICLTLFAVSTAYDVEVLTEEEWQRQFENARENSEEFSLILNSQAKKAVENFVHQMQCGWPEYGVPPLAPYTNANVELHMTKSVVDAFLQMLRFRFDGLDQMEIKKLKVTIAFGKKVQFHFNFKELKATANTMNTNTLIDMLEELGLSVRYEGSGPMEFALENLSIIGQFKYKMPLLFGSIEIYKFQATIALGSVRSNLPGLMGNGRLNEFINDQIEYLIPAFINGHQHEISKVIEETIVPRVNEKMKGKKIWSLIFGGSGSSTKCVPTPAPW